MTMKSFFAAAAVALRLGSTAYASTVATLCPETDVCYGLNIPDATASSGDGDIYFQISAPTSYQWVALGQGSSMTGSNIFVMYTSSDGTNVTVSPRLGTGQSEPQHDTAAQITLLGGTGVSDGVMTANVRCSNCNSWSGGSMDFSSSSSDWIHAYKTGDSLNTDDLGASISQHNAAAAFTWDLTDATGGDSVNPFVSSAAAASGTQTGSSTSLPACTSAATTQTQTLASPSGSGCPTTWPASYSTAWPTTRPTWASSCFASGSGSWPTSAPWRNTKRAESCDDGSGSSSSTSSSTSGSSSSDDSGSSSLTDSSAQFGGDAALGNRITTIHGVLAALAFVAFFPIGGILIRVASFTGLIWVHAALQVVGYLIYIVAFGMGVWLANEMDLLQNKHPIIGIVLFVILFTQPLSGVIHHRLFKKHSSRTAWSYVHIGIGRLAVLLGLINGGFGLELAQVSRGGTIAYAVCAAIVGLVYICAIVYGERKRRSSATRPFDLRQKQTLGSRDGSEPGIGM